MGYREELEIDKFTLDTEWQFQSIKFSEWAEKEVEALYLKDKAKEQLDLVRAQLDSSVRKNPEAYGLEKVTEGAIQNVILQHKDYMDISRAYLDAVKEARILGVAREAFDHRKKALEKLTELFLSQYWAEPREGKITKEVREEQARDQHLQSLEGRLSRRMIK